MRLFTNILIFVTVILIIFLTIVVAQKEPNEQFSPSDTLNADQIYIQNGQVIINVEDAILVAYNDTNSMDPIMDIEANGIEIPVTDDTTLEIGDIVSYETSWNETLVSHRIVDISEDEEGTYYTLKGDNNSSEDPGKIRLEQIKYKLIGVLY
ncbi:hypothetical protein HOD38_00250 [archaeon]|mgnify:CR=1 FL=1|jgi:hypothetical protein|nr:hypothetical protein [archaeon]MBT4396677.1 hypothetical protein [archaeon]MBT4441287.1 hypothetical protein [archaeon]